MTEETRDAARALMSASRKATLATLDGAGAPFASLILIAPARAGGFVSLISDLAEHTKNLRADSRASLLLDGTEGLAEPLTGPRLTLLGRAEISAAAADRAGFLAAHPSAALYADFSDFAVWRFAVERAHFVAGFGRIEWLEPEDLAPQNA